MIRRLEDKDNDKLMELIKDEKEFNIYILGDIENHGYDKDFLHIYGEFDDADNLKAVLVRFFSIFNVYAKENFNSLVFSNIINCYEDRERLIGKKVVVEAFEKSNLRLKPPEVHFFSVLKDLNRDFKARKDVVIKRVSLNDIDRIVELKSRIKEFFQGSSNIKKVLEQEYKSETASGYYIEVDGKMVSYAQTSVENDKSAIVVSVMTDEAYRNRGYASAILKTLCEEKLMEGKSLCLYYKNQKAGEIYKKIGFKEIGMWNMYEIEK